MFDLPTRRFFSITLINIFKTNLQNKKKDIPLFYSTDITSTSVTLNEEESWHCIKVLRLKSGDEALIIDGCGGFYKAEITDPHPKKCILKINDTKKEFNKRKSRLHLAIAPTKNSDRFDWFIEKATELGIDEITPFTAQHSERISIKEDRIKRVMITAAKQSVKAFLPKVNPMTPFTDLLKTEFKGDKFIAHCHQGFDKKHILECCQKEKNTLILIGPEGDFTNEEITQALECGFVSVSLSQSRLRTETAALMATALINGINLT